MNPVFKDLNFWNLFVSLDREDVENEMVEKQLELLSADFNIETKDKEYKHDEESFQDDYSIVYFEFDLNNQYCLQLEYIPKPEGGGKYLHLKDKTQNVVHLMGWWDLDAWHPYCLKEEELINNNNRLKKQKNSPWFGTDLPLLLLHDFVGFDQADKAEKFAQKIFKTYQELAIPGFDKIEPKPIAVFYQEEEKYNWIEDSRLGWVFESKVYNCYSLRNPAHNEGKEKGKFPFKEWNEIVKSL